MLFITLLTVALIWAAVTTVVALIQSVTVAKVLYFAEMLLLTLPLPAYYIVQLATFNGDPTAGAAIPLAIIMSLGVAVLVAGANVGIWAWCAEIPKSSSRLATSMKIAALVVVAAELIGGLSLLFQLVATGPEPRVADLLGPLAWMLFIPFVAVWIVSQRGAIKSFWHKAY